MKVLVFSANFDLATAYGYTWMREIAVAAKTMGHEVYEIYGSQATQQGFFNAIQNYNPDLIFAMGHGDPDQFAGQNNEIVLTACQNDQVASGRQCMMLSCLMGQVLAPSMVSKTARTVSAYISEFVWIINPDYSGNMVEDPFAYPFRRAIVEPAKALLGGGGWPRWYRRTVELFNQGISEWFNVADPNAGDIVSALRHDRDSLIVLGEYRAEAALSAPALPLMLIAGGLASILLL